MEDITDSLNTGWDEMYMESRRYTAYPVSHKHDTQYTDKYHIPKSWETSLYKTRKQILEGKDNQSITLPSDNIRKV